MQIGSFRPGAGPGAATPPRWSARAARVFGREFRRDGSPSSRLNLFSPLGIFIGDFGPDVQLRDGRRNQNRLPTEKPPQPGMRHSFQTQPKISWNLFIGWLNYSCQLEDDAGFETMNDPTLGDEELLRLTRAGDEGAFTALYRRHQGPVYRFALQMSGCESVADDVTQEVFLALMCESFRFDPSQGLLASYLFGVARNQVRRHLARGRSQVSLDEDCGDEAPFLEPIIAREDPLADLTLEEGLSALRRAILTLPLHYREVVVLCDLEEMSYEESARALGCAVGTIRSRLHRAHALLVQKLREATETSVRMTRNRIMRCFG